MFKVNKTKYFEVNNATFVKSALDLENKHFLIGKIQWRFEKLDATSCSRSNLNQIFNFHDHSQSD